MLFEADVVVLFKTDVLPLDIVALVGEARGSYRRTRATAAETDEGMEWRGEIARLRHLAGDLARNLHPPPPPPPPPRS